MAWRGEEESVRFRKFRYEIPCFVFRVYLHDRISFYAIAWGEIRSFLSFFPFSRPFWDAHWRVTNNLNPSLFEQNIISDILIGWSCFGDWQPGYILSSGRGMSNPQSSVQLLAYPSLHLCHSWWHQLPGPVSFRGLDEAICDRDVSESGLEVICMGCGQT